MRRRATTAVVLILTITGLVACGSDDADSSHSVDASAAEPGEATWSQQLLDGRSGPDSPTLLDTDGDQIVVTMSTDDGTILGFATDGSSTLQAGTPTETGLDYLALAGTAHLGNRWITVGAGGLSEDGEELLFANHSFASDDGRTWADVGASGLDDPADILDVAGTDDGVVAVGTVRTGPDPSSGGFRAAAWTSPDGVTWTTVPLPGGEREGVASSVVVTDDEILAAGSIGNQGALWSSTDGGGSWSLVSRDGLADATTLGPILAQDGVLLLSGATPGTGDDELTAVIFRSTDGGQTWAGVAEPPPLDDNDSAPPLSAGGGHFFTSTSIFPESWSDPELCYADIDLCRQDTVVTLYESGDGDHWRRIDTGGIGEGEAGELDDITATDAGEIVALQQVEAGTAVWTWPAEVALPGEAEPTRPTTDVPVLDEDEPIEPGVTYGAPLYIHCGMDWLFLDGEAWERTDDGADVETGAGEQVQDDWPVAQQTIFGFATLQADGHIDYSIGDGEVIATYQRATSQPPGCE